MKKIINLLLLLFLLYPYSVVADEAVENNDLEKNEGDTSVNQVNDEGESINPKLEQEESEVKLEMDKEHSSTTQKAKDSISDDNTDVENNDSINVPKENNVISELENKSISDTNNFDTKITNTKNISLLGKIIKSNTKIYNNPEKGTEDYFKAGDTYTNTVFYIKKQMNIDKDVYYLISNQPSSTHGVIGWVRKDQLSTYTHTSVDSKKKVFYLNGRGVAYNKPWGGSKDVVYNSSQLDKLNGYKFEVNLTNNVGNNTWYKGLLNGKTVWIHSNHLTRSSEISRLGKFKDVDAKVYSAPGNELDYNYAGNELINKVYYIKESINLNGQLYYLISNQPSNSTGTIGWVRKNDLLSYTHEGLDSKEKTLYLKGKGIAYNRPWGGKENIVYNINDLKKRQGMIFQVNLTQKVGNNLWYRGILEGKTVWIHSDHVKSPQSTSKLGKIKSNKEKIYSSPGNELTASSAGSENINKVFYIKQQINLNGILYYNISNYPSIHKGTIGWVKEDSMLSYTHVNVDNISKIFYLSGKGVAYNKPWGGSQNVIYDSEALKNMQGYGLIVNLTNKVGDNIWYRANLKGNSIWIHSSHLMNITGSATSRLGKIKSETAKIYKGLGDETTTINAGSTYTNKVFYIKRKSQIDNKIYYLLSNKPSSTEGTIGWVKKEDVNSYTHEGIDNNSKNLYLKGTGLAYDRPWGGKENIIYNNTEINAMEGYSIQVNLTQKVGNNIWYRGIVNGKTVWIHSSHVTGTTGTSTSKLGKLKSDSSKIYKRLGDESSAINSGEKYLNSVYYIKRQSEINGEIYYLISNLPSSTSGTIGWVKQDELTSYSHQSVDSNKKKLTLKGKGIAYNKPWGGSKNIVFDLKDMINLKGEILEVTLTNKVGGQLWYKGQLQGETVWVHESHLEKNTANYSYYDLTLSEAVSIQMKATPKTDKYVHYVHGDYIQYNNKGNYYYVTASTLNVRGGPGTNYSIVDTLNYGEKVSIRKKVGDWYRLYWVNAKEEDVRYYLDPNNFINDDVQKFQFLDLSRSSDISASVLNDFLSGKGTLAGQGQAFIDASIINSINDVYLVSHAILETGNGTSTLASGVKYNGKTVYNMYGIGAYDSCPVDCGAKKAYEEGWTTPYKAIVGGAKFIGRDYISSGQNTLYKMRWNPLAMDNTGSATHQYATDIGWASKQITTMYNLYQQIGSYSLHLDIPSYR
ncbi:N-acetylglucosaminidase [Virgibacillus sp. AGTR]|uniref:N-acetylglucosaminidase n=1 Tax=Virgibacillus sp. AGTR TaxID=2812055 RepID=UPI0019663E3D|nr:N-acetylglucosaminidase [Virgibacillus sp. AGTR]MCC2250636.1 N-acetylglucosaminidase [Virgibacillus sp. AGTR]QRZ18448.1 N-acetylglucosaminidase [Virgibacillus sp. AGTR]